MLLQLINVFLWYIYGRKRQLSPKSRDQFSHVIRKAEYFKPKMATRRRSIIGLTWKKLNNSPAVRDENEHSWSPVTRSMSRDTREPLRENINREKVVHLGTKQEEQDGKKTKAILRRVSSVRDAFGNSETGKFIPRFPRNCFYLY